jgi:hypothetical protein
MKYRVDWIDLAQERLEAIWTAATNKLAVFNASNTIDSLLAKDPYRNEAIFGGNEHTLIVEPLAVDYVILEDARLVLVLRVFLLGFLADQD